MAGRRGMRLAIAMLTCVGLSACGGGGRTVVERTVVEHTTTAPGRAPTPKSVPSRTAAAPTSPAPAHLRAFRTPTGNIGCVLIGVARCDIRNRDWSPPGRPPSCRLDYGQGLSVGSRGRGHLVCAGDTALDPSAPVLGYGRDSRFGGYACQSRTAGTTCTSDATGHGFFLSRASFRTF